jgi:hypothetical protein
MPRGTCPVIIAIHLNNPINVNRNEISASGTLSRPIYPRDRVRANLHERDNLTAELWRGNISTTLESPQPYACPAGQIDRNDGSLNIINGVTATLPFLH